MKKSIAVVLAAVLFLCGGAMENAWARAKKSKEKVSSEEAKASKTKKPQENKQKEALTQARSAINNSTWSIVFSGTLPKGMASGDTLVFKDNQFSSTLFSARGFEPTNFSLTMQDDGVVVFETMQASEKEGTIFWRGELGADQKTLRGMFSHVLSDKQTQDIYFSGSKDSGPAIAPVVPASPEQKTSEGV